jgi:hypothetical protein
MTSSAVSSTAAVKAAGRPAAVTLVAVLAVAAAVYLLIDGGLVLRDAARDDTGAIVDGIIPIALGILALAVAFGALRMRAWAWKLFMMLAVVGLTSQILRHFSFGDPRYARMAVSAFVVFALTPRDVQVAFGIRTPPNADLAERTRNPLDRH